jgi:site-specific DNA recombinase
METKTILIARVSDVEQRKALPAQKLNLDKYAKELGHKSEYHEFDESAYKDARQKFSLLVDRISTLKEYGIIVFDKIDRFTRDASQKEVRTMASLVEKGKIEMHFPSDNLVITKNSPATDLFRLGIGMLLAKYYSDSSRDNVKRRFKQMLNDGIWVHKAPIGYKNVNIGTEKRPIKVVKVDESKAHYIVKAFELRAIGTPYAVIAKQLSAEGFRSNVKSEKGPGKSFLERILNNKFYYGVMTVNGVDYPHEYETLIDRALYNQCQAIRNQRKHDKTKYDSKDYIFKKIVKCGRCGRAVSPFRARNTVYLRCANPNCDNPNTAQSLVIDEMYEEIARVNVPVEWLDQIIDELRNRHDNQQLYYEKNLEQTRTEYDKIKDKMHKLYSDRLDGRITPQVHDEFASELESRQQELNDRLKMLTSDNKGFQVTASYLLDLAQRANQLFKDSDDGLKQKLLEYLLSNIELNDKKLSYTVNDPYRTIAETKKNPNITAGGSLWCDKLSNQLTSKAIELEQNIVFQELVDSLQLNGELLSV